jgi:hypothetical protein
MIWKLAPSTFRSILQTRLIRVCGQGGMKARNQRTVQPRLRATIEKDWGMSDQQNITGRDGYILVEALSSTIEALSALPFEFRPDNNITDMKRILDGLIKRDAALAGPQWLARRKVEQVLTHSPRRG